MNFFRLSFCVFGALLCSFSKAEFSVDYSLNVGFDIGGDHLARAVLDTGSTRDLKAGSGALLSIGVDFVHPIDEQHLSTRASLGFKGAGITASNGSLDFFRGSIEVSEHYMLNTVPLNFGLGLVYHFANSINGTEFFEDVSVPVKQSLGYFLQADYFFERNQQTSVFAEQGFRVGLRYTYQKYKFENNEEFDGSTFGFQIGVIW